MCLPQVRMSHQHGIERWGLWTDFAHDSDSLSLLLSEEDEDDEEEELLSAAVRCASRMRWNFCRRMSKRLALDACAFSRELAAVAETTGPETCFCTWNSYLRTVPSFSPGAGGDRTHRFVLKYPHFQVLFSLACLGSSGFIWRRAYKV